MTMVRKLERITLDRDRTHTEVAGSYAILVDGDGESMLQIDTYGSEDR